LSENTVTVAASTGLTPRLLKVIVSKIRIAANGLKILVFIESSFIWNDENS
jgi:hypothetical protein